MTIIRAFVGVCAVALFACGDDRGDSDGEIEQVVDSLAGFCTATFTADHEVVDVFGDVVLGVKAGDRFLLTSLDLFPQLVYRKSGGALRLDLDEGAPVDAPCLAEDAALTTELAAFTAVEVFADANLTQPVCMIEQFEHGPANSHGYGAVANGYEVSLGGAFCDGLESGYVRATVVQHGGTSYHDVPILELFRLEE